VYGESASSPIRDSDEDADGDEDMTMPEDTVHSWKIDHSSGDHKLRGKSA